MKWIVTLVSIVISILLSLWDAYAVGPGNGRPLIPSEISIEMMRQDDALRIEANRKRLFEGELACRRQPSACEPLVTIEGRPDLQKNLDKVFVPSEPRLQPHEGLR